MSAAEFFQAVRDTGIATAVRESALAYPIILSTHMASIACFGGMILMTDMRLLGLALRGIPVSDVIRGSRWGKRLGFVIMVTCGVLLASAKANEYYLNPYFQIKMTLLGLVGLHGLAFRRGVYADGATPGPGVAKTAGCLSLILWLGIMTAGRWIAYYEKPRNASTVVAASVSAPTVTWAAASTANAVLVSTSSRRITKAAIPSETCKSTIPRVVAAAVRNGADCRGR